jgi:hypothetical protein
VSFVLSLGVWRYYLGLNRFTWRPCAGRDRGDTWAVGLSFEYYLETEFEVGLEDFFPQQPYHAD